MMFGNTEFTPDECSAEWAHWAEHSPSPTAYFSTRPSNPTGTSAKIFTRPSHSSGVNPDLGNQQSLPACEEDHSKKKIHT